MQRRCLRARAPPLWALQGGDWRCVGRTRHQSAASTARAGLSYVHVSAARRALQRALSRLPIQPVTPNVRGRLGGRHGRNHGRSRRDIHRTGAKGSAGGAGCYHPVHAARPASPARAHLSRTLPIGIGQRHGTEGSAGLPRAPARYVVDFAAAQTRTRGHATPAHTTHAPHTRTCRDWRVSQCVTLAGDNRRAHWVPEIIVLRSNTCI